MLISKFITRVSPDTPGAPNELMRQAIIDAADRFCVVTRAWFEIQDAALLYDGVSDYELDLPAGSRILGVKNIWCGNAQLAPVTMEQLQLLLPDWQTATSSRPRYYNSEFDKNSFRVFPAPSSPSLSLRIQGSFAPTEASESLPDFLWEDYRDAIVAGAKADLMLRPGVLWSNPALGAFNSAKFEASTNEARIRILHGQQTGSLTVAPRRFF